MPKNFFIIAYRNILRNKGFSIINISGLAIGMASAMLILLWVQNEMSYDAEYKNSDRFYEVWYRGENSNGLHCWDVTTKMFASGARAYPEVDEATRVFWSEYYLFTVGEKKLKITGNMVDPEFLTMFQFPFIEGNMKTALNNPNDVVITEKTAKLFFGNKDPMGKTMLVDNKYNFIVSGVIKDLPNNTNFNFTFLLPWSFMKTTGQDDSCWGCGSTHNYVMLKPNTSLASVNDKLKNILKEHGGPTTTTQAFLYPVSRLRLYSNFENGVPSGGKIETVRVFILIAVFILLIACINFMNMSTARSEKRAKEVGIRKVVGAQKKSLIVQFLGESILIAFIAGILALILVQLCLPAFDKLTNKELFIDYSNIYFWISFISFILFTGITAGSYPAFFFSAFQPVKVLKGTFKKENAAVNPRKVLVVLQFTFAIIMIVCTIIIKKQIDYAQERESGYNKNDLVYVPLQGDIEKNLSLIKNDLINKGIATSVTKTSAPITEGWSSGGGNWQNMPANDKTEFNFFNIDENIIKTAGLTLVQGRDFDLKNYPTDSNAAIINEAALKVMNFKQPLGQIIDTGSWNTQWHVIGVVKDFIIQSPYDPVKPMIIQGPKANWFNVLHVKFNHANSIAANIAAMEKVFKEYNPEYPFEYYFVDEKYAVKFEDEQTTGILTAFFAGLTIFISCLGLFGLATYMTENRIKEIGVRKVLGASVTGIATLLSKDFIKLVIVAILIASPIAWWSMNKWLSGYNYHIDISIWVFLAAGFLSIFIAIVTVSYQAIKAAVVNPVKSLRTE
jgi:putative ABC transport system permease protein